MRAFLLQQKVKGRGFLRGGNEVPTNGGAKNGPLNLKKHFPLHYLITYQQTSNKKLYINEGIFFPGTATHKR